MSATPLTDAYLAAIKRAWLKYEAGRMSGDEFFSFVATIQQLIKRSESQ